VKGDCITFMDYRNSPLIHTGYKFATNVAHPRQVVQPHTKLQRPSGRLGVKNATDTITSEFFPSSDH
jgi:hypothetical protein